MAQLIKFTGCYHGHADSFLVQAGSGVLTLGLPDSPGVPKSSTGADTLLAELNMMQRTVELHPAYGSSRTAYISAHAPADSS